MSDIPPRTRHHLSGELPEQLFFCLESTVYVCAQSVRRGFALLLVNGSTWRFSNAWYVVNVCGRIALNYGVSSAGEGGEPLVKWLCFWHTQRVGLGEPYALGGDERTVPMGRNPVFLQFLRRSCFQYRKMSTVRKASETIVMLPSLQSSRRVLKSVSSRLFASALAGRSVS